MTGTDLHDRIHKFLDTALEKISVKEYDDAIEKLKAAEVLDENNPEILYNLGICYSRKELFNTASDYFKRLLNLKATFIDVITVHKLLAYSLLMVDEIKEAMLYIKKGLSISKTDTGLLSMLGFAHEKLNNFNEAVEIYKEILEIDNYNYNACNSIAYITAEQNGDLAEAAEFAKKALRGRPYNPAYLDTMGYIHMLKGQADLAKKYLKAALEKLPASKEIKDHINMLLEIDR